MSGTKEELKIFFQRPIAFHRSFVDIGGSITAALFLSQLFYWSDRGEDPDGWIYKTYAEWTDETRMSRKELDGARKKLRVTGLLEEKKCGIPAKLYYRINFKSLQKAFEKFSGTTPENPEKPDCTNKADPPGQSSLHLLDKQCSPKGTNYLYTETTTETTAASKEEISEKPEISEAAADPFFSGQARQIARELKKTHFSQARNFLTDTPWGQLASKLNQPPEALFQELESFGLKIHADKQSPESYVSKIINNIYQNPGSELNSTFWKSFVQF